MMSLSLDERTALARVLALPPAQLHEMAAALHDSRASLQPLSYAQRRELHAALPYGPSPVSAAQLRAIDKIPQLAAAPATDTLRTQAAVYDVLVPLACEARTLAQAALGAVGLIDGEIDDLTQRLQAHLLRRLAEPLPPAERARLRDQLQRLQTPERGRNLAMAPLAEEIELFRMSKLRELVVDRLRDEHNAASEVELHGIAATLTEEPEDFESADS